MEFKENEMEKKEDAENDFATIHRNIETAARKVAHHTKAEREK